MKKVYAFIALLIALLFFSGNLYAKIIVESVNGEVAYKKSKQWLPLTKGLVLEEGTKISTGMKSWADIKIEDCTVRIEQLTMMKIFRNKLTADSQNTHLGLKHGSLKTRVTRIGTLKTSFKITTPVATSSVRGTWREDFYGPRTGHTVRVFEGTVLAENNHGNTQTVSGNSVFRQAPNNSQPQNLLLGVSSASVLQIHDVNITPTEVQALEFSGGDTTDLTGGQGGNLLPTTGGTSTVNLQIQW